MKIIARKKKRFFMIFFLRFFSFLESKKSELHLEKNFFGKKIFGMSVFLAACFFTTLNILLDFFLKFWWKKWTLIFWRFFLKFLFFFSSKCQQQPWSTVPHSVRTFWLCYGLQPKIPIFWNPTFFKSHFFKSHFFQPVF